ncbi:MAG: phospholipase A [Gammaproteobacteria bacterium]
MQSCLMETMEEAGDEITVGHLKKICMEILEAAERAQAADMEGAATDIIPLTDIQKRYTNELSIRGNRFAITAHRPTYILLAAYNSSEANEEPFVLAGDDSTFKGTESKFQVSLKFLLAEDLIGNNGAIYAGYTNRSFWQVYDSTDSSPFRETNHEPEIWFSWNTRWRFLGVTNRVVRGGFVHQSNGRGGTLSRSWNRLFAEFIFEKGKYSGSFKPWWRIPEDADNDDNPDIDDYLGYFEFLNVYTKSNHSFSVMLRNNLRSSKNRGAVQVEWNFPLLKYLDGYVQWFNGYGESLIDYNHNVNSFGIGVSLTDWL